MNEFVIGYKVVSEDMGSCRVVSERARAHYAVNEWTSPPIPKSKLLAFESQREARNFVYIYGNEKIYKAVLRNPGPAEVNVVWCGCSYDTLAAAWSQDNPDKGTPSCWNCPRGTVLCDAVMLLEEVTEK